MENMAGLREFYRGRRVLVTGHTGFKGTWLCHALRLLGAEVWGFALPPVWESMYRLCPPEVHSVYGDLRQIGLWQVIGRAKPEVVFHLAAQPLVQTGYERPLESYEVNVMGTAKLLEGLRQMGGVRSVVVVTTDKVYASSVLPCKEEDRLGGFDPYSSSKACAELTAACYRRCFLEQMGTALSCVRAGNVIGGGDFGKHRILPDCVRAAMGGEPIRLRQPQGVRPYQFVLEPLSAYLLLGWRQYEEPTLADSYNIAPAAGEEVTNAELAEIFCQCWKEGASWVCRQAEGMGPEREILRLDGRKIAERLGWRPMWGLRRAVEETVRWAKCMEKGGDLRAETLRQLHTYFQEREDSYDGAGSER